VNQGPLEPGAGTAIGIATIAGIAAAALVVVLLFVVWKKGRPFTSGEVFRASRLSAGNHLFPTQVLIKPTSIVHYTPEWFGRLEHSMHMAHVASVRIDTNLMFSDVFIETTGGASHPVPRPQKGRCHPHEGVDRAVSDRVLPPTGAGGRRYSADWRSHRPHVARQVCSDNETVKRLWTI
jgi:hypothetical protein